MCIRDRRHRRAALLQRFLNSPDIQQWLTAQAIQDAELTMKRADVEAAKGLTSLSPADLALAPAALQQELAARGLIPGQPGTAIPPSQGGIPGGAPGMAGLMQATAPPGTPAPGLGTTMGGGPGGQQALGQALGGPTPQTSPFGGLGLAQAAGQNGQPVGPTLGGL